MHPLRTAQRRPDSRRRACALGLAVTVLAAPLALALPAAASTTANEVVHLSDANGDGNYGVVLRDLVSGVSKTVLPPDTVNEWVYDEPELSPNGARVALSTDRGSATFDEGIAVVNRDGTGFRRLTNPPNGTASTDPYSVDLSAAWSPDGTEVLFTRVTERVNADGSTTTTSGLFTVAVPASTTTPAPAPVAVPGASDGFSADWSPDGSRIVFAVYSQAGNGALTIVNASGVRTSLGTTGFSPTWSPDGRTIAFSTITVPESAVGRGDDVAQIATVPATGGTRTVLSRTRPTSARTVAEYPAWTPDGESLVYDLFAYDATKLFPPGDVWAIDRAGIRAGRITTSVGDEAQPDVNGPRPAAVVAGSPSTFTPVTPRRLLDTRAGVGAPQAKVGPAGVLNLQVTGASTSRGAVPAGATAVVLNLTATRGTSATDVRAYPTGTPVPGSSTLNAATGQTVPNLVTVAIGTGGKVSLRNGAGSVDLIGDIAGWYTPDTAGSRFAALTPSRVLDTRKGVGARTARVGAKGKVDLLVRGTLPTTGGGTVTVPSDVRAVVLNVTAAGATTTTDIRVYPTTTSTAVPVISNLNLRAGQSLANLVTVAVPTSGKVTLRNLAGSVDLIADLAGYYSASAPSHFVPVRPTRFLDTRAGIGAAPILMTAGTYTDVKVAGTRGVPVGATAAVMNLTGTRPTGTTDVRAYPAYIAPPDVSNLNLTRGVTRANLAIVRLSGDGRVRVRNSLGNVHVIGDLAGYMIS